ncbi:MAG: four helix bundle protein [Deltaproteobacteria bacterium]|nr:four helix bundle protein [Deltaproteobacteria bacterium]
MSLSPSAHSAVDQILRSSTSISANISEGLWPKGAALTYY